jgi:hypothetical protein
LVLSAGVNAVLAEFFGVSDTDTGNIPQEVDNIPTLVGNILSSRDNIPVTRVGMLSTKTGNIPLESLVMEGLPGKQKA